jgi:hypothetical protein
MTWVTQRRVEKDVLELSFGLGVLLDGPEEKWFRSEVEYSANGERPRRIGMRHVEQTERLVEKINSLDHSQGGGAVLPQALNAVRAARILLRQSEYSEEVGERLERHPRSLNVKLRRFRCVVAMRLLRRSRSGS